jgi:RecA-family ATPase
MEIKGDVSVREIALTHEDGDSLEETLVTGFTIALQENCRVVIIIDDIYCYFDGDNKSALSNNDELIPDTDELPSGPIDI